MSAPSKSMSSLKKIYIYIKHLDPESVVTATLGADQSVILPVCRMLSRKKVGTSSF